MKRPSLLLVVVIVLASTTLPSLALAWGGEGHQVVALIAERHLKPAVQTKIRELLDNADISDAEIASWADAIKRSRRNTAPWHYVDIPLVAQGYDEKRDDPKGEHIVYRLAKLESKLSNNQIPKEARAEALKFIVHLIGDLHQPLHTAERNGDKGGNELKVTFLGKSADLHHVWDTALLRQYIGNQRIADYADALDQRADDVELAEWAKGSPTDWVNQSWMIARDVVYKEVPAEGGTKLDADYIERNRIVVETQLQRAGVRLAEVLNRALAD